ncbi:MAG: TIGR04219 family outer membrane beta-barrel protein [Nitrospirota bacterium]
MPLYVACLFVLSLLVVPCSAFAFFAMDVGVGYWRQTPSGTLNYKPVSGSGVVGDIDLKDDLNLGRETKPFVRIRAELPLILPNIYLMATPMQFKGSGTLTRSISYNNQQFAIGAPVDSKLKLDHYDLALFYPIPVLKTATGGKLNIDLGLNARKIDFEGTITGPNLALVTTSASKTLSIYVPMIFAAVQVKPIDAFSIEAEVRGIAYSNSHYYDYIGRLRVNPIPLVFIAAGYRAETIKIDQSDVKADIKFGGPFVEAGLHF